jgi:hypothetical protein
MGWIDPRYEAARRKYWTRHDAHRFAAPGTPEARMPGWLDPSATRVRLKEAQEEEARAQEAAAQEEFERGLLKIRRELAEVKYELAWRQFCHKYGYVPKDQRSLKYDGQPRTEAGRFDFGKMPKPILARAPLPLPLRAPVVLRPPTGVENALREYAAASKWNSSERRAVLGFNARAFEPGADTKDPAAHARILTRDEVAEACPHYWEVQSITNQAADLNTPGA